MIFSLLFGIGLLIWSGISFRKYILFENGVKMKGTVTKAEYREHGVRWPMFLAEITYRYEVYGKEYINTEISDSQKHMFKTQLMKGEPIAIMVRKKNPAISTIKSSAHYLKSCIYLLILGLISTLVGIVGM